MAAEVRSWCGLMELSASEENMKKRKPKQSSAARTMVIGLVLRRERAERILIKGPRRRWVYTGWQSLAEVSRIQREKESGCARPEASGREDVRKLQLCYLNQSRPAATRRQERRRRGRRSTSERARVLGSKGPRHARRKAVKARARRRSVGSWARAGWILSTYSRARE